MRAVWSTVRLVLVFLFLASFGARTLDYGPPIPPAPVRVTSRFFVMRFLTSSCSFARPMKEVVEAGKLERGLYSVLLHHPIKQALNLVYRPLRGLSFPFPLLPLVFYIDKRHISINYSYNNSLSLSPTLSFSHFLTNI